MNFDTNGQIKFMVILMLFPWSAWAITRFSHQKPIGLVEVLILVAAGILVGISMSNEVHVDSLTASLGKLGLAVKQPIQEGHASQTTVTVFEYRIHSAVTFTRRLTELDRFAAANQLEVCDCRAESDPSFE